MDMELDEQEKKTIEENNANPPPEAEQEIPFKKPTLLIGKIGRLPKKVQVPTFSASTSKQDTASSASEENPAKESIETLQHEVATTSDVKSVSFDSPKDKPDEHQLDSNIAAAQQAKANSIISVPYKEPNWSGLPETSGKPYAFEVLKNGKILQTIDLMKKPFWVFGRLLSCDIPAQHPTISRYHAVVQYRDIPSETEPPGFYVYDLGSTHGTFLNGKNNKLKPKMYAPIRVGHILRLGLSQRSYILTGPEDDQEEESEFSVTELKQMREQKIKEHQEKMQQAELEREEKRKKAEERGVDWGMGDDADDVDEELGENPYASTNNEELYLDDPKKALRGFFEREGLELDYICTEQGMGQFLCKVELPVDDEMGRPIVAEVLHRGKKKEAVVQCALEACRILDRFGVLRQATHESKKRKAKNWEQNDYYDSDEDTFLDRTGTIEKKREKRMKVSEPEQVETYESLLEKEREITSSIAKIEQKLYLAQKTQEDAASTSTQSEEDSLDSYMNSLAKDKLDKPTISKLKLELAELKKNHSNVIKLANIAKPADLPTLVPAASTSTSTMDKPRPAFPLFGKRRLVPVKFPAKPGESTVTQTSNEDDEEESDEEEKDAKETLSEAKETLGEAKETLSEPKDTFSEAKESTSSCVDAVGEDNGLDQFNATNIASCSSSNNASVEEFVPAEAKSPPNETSSRLSDNHDNETYDTFAAKAENHMQKIVKMLQKLEKCNSTEMKLDLNWETVKVKRIKILELVERLKVNRTAKLQNRVAVELSRLFHDVVEVFEKQRKVISKLGTLARELNPIFMTLNKDIEELKEYYHQLIKLFKIEQNAYNESNQKDNQDSCNKSEEQPKVLLHDEKLKEDRGNKESEQKSSEDMNSEENSQETDEKRRKKNQKRNELRQYKAEMEKQKGYEEDASKEDYNMWVPPTDQSGDGRTDLNDKYGY